ncbi:MAG: class I SAM-dependent methyltransferase [Opitutaceae bacterium]
MDSAEYANLEKIELLHWYYAGKRVVVRRWLERMGRLGPARTLLDCGAGTGRFAQEMEPLCRVLVLDDHEESLRLLRARFKPEQIFSLSGDTIPLPDASLDCVTALDVLEHVPDDAAVVRGFQRLLKPGGIAAVTVPASMALWSDWDVGLHHYRRYHRAQLRALFPGEAWEIVYVNYTNVVVYPVVWAVRKWRVFRRALGRTQPVTRTEDRLPPPWLNGLLKSIFVGMASWRMPFPFGVSLVLIARRRAS